MRTQVHIYFFVIFGYTLLYVCQAGGDGGYEDTAKMVSQAALCALQDRSQLSCSGGVLTPAVAFG